MYELLMNVAGMRLKSGVFFAKCLHCGLWEVFY